MTSKKLVARLRAMAEDIEDLSGVVENMRDLACELDEEGEGPLSRAQACEALWDLLDPDEQKAIVDMVRARAGWHATATRIGQLALEGL